MSTSFSRIVALVATLCLVGAFLAFFLLRWLIPFDGALVIDGMVANSEQGVVVEPHSEYPGALRAGDIVLAVDGISIASWTKDIFARNLPRPAWEIGGTAAYTIWREGLEFQVEQPLVRYPLGTIVAASWGSLAYAIGGLLVALFAFSRKPDEKALQVYMLLTAITLISATYAAGIQVSDFVGGYGLLHQLFISNIGYPLSFPLFLHFVLLFPQPQPWVSKRRWVIPLLYVPPIMALSAMILMAPPSSVVFELLFGECGWCYPIFLIYPVLTLITVIITLIRARDPVSRAQIRWVLFALIVTATFGILTDSIPNAVQGRPLVNPNVTSFVAILIPFSIVIAILRYRLFDIDIIIRKTLVYGALTASLALVYFGSVVLIQQAIGRITGAEQSTLAIVLSTLLIAALFSPLRQRLQDFIDRRFYRRRYDAEQVLAAFARIARDETNLDRLTDELVQVVQETMQPNELALWLPRLVDAPSQQQKAKFRRQSFIKKDTLPS